MGWLDPDIPLELDEGEEILFTSRRHWLLLLRDGGAPLIVAIGLFGLTGFRAVGGQFFVDVIPGSVPMDLWNWILVALMGALAYFWLRPVKGTAKNTKPSIYIRAFYPISILLLAGMVWFRLQGGDIFAFEPSQAVGIDGFNTLLLVGAVLGVLYFLYVLIDWRDNALVLTNFRVVYDDEQFLVRHVQQQILIPDIQQVFFSQNTYPSVVFGYGTIRVQSFSPRRLEFTFATSPQEMTNRINGEINKLRQRQGDDMLRRLLETRVYDAKPPAAPTTKPYLQKVQEEQEKRGPISWLFPPNPEIKGDTLIWRPAAIYLAFILLRPVGLFLAVLIGAFVLLSAQLLATELFVLLLLLNTLVCGFWIFWIREEYVNDTYILTRREIVDVDKRPFGPVNRRSAPLDNIQDISFDISFLESLLGYGTVKIRTGGGGGGNEFTFNHVPNARDVQMTINDYLTDFRKSKREQGLQDSVALIREYHMLQRERGELMDAERLRAASEPTNGAAPQPLSEELSQQVAAEVRNQMRSYARSARRRQRSAGGAGS